MNKSFYLKVKYLEGYSKLLFLGLIICFSISSSGQTNIDSLIGQELYSLNRNTNFSIIPEKIYLNSSDQSAEVELNFSTFNELYLPEIDSKMVSGNFVIVKVRFRALEHSIYSEINEESQFNYVVYQTKWNIIPINGFAYTAVLNPGLVFSSGDLEMILEHTHINNRFRTTFYKALISNKRFVKFNKRYNIFTNELMLNISGDIELSRPIIIPSEIFVNFIL